jgi:hypothetical protein
MGLDLRCQQDDNGDHDDESLTEDAHDDAVFGSTSQSYRAWHMHSNSRLGIRGTPIY